MNNLRDNDTLPGYRQHEWVPPAAGYLPDDIRAFINGRVWVCKCGAVQLPLPWSLFIVAAVERAFGASRKYAGGPPEDPCMMRFGEDGFVVESVHSECPGER